MAEQKKPSPVHVLVELAKKTPTEVWLDPEEIPYVSITLKDKTVEHIPLDSSKFRRWLGNAYYKRLNVTPEYPGGFAINDAIHLLEWHAEEQKKFHAHPLRHGIKLADGKDSAHYFDIFDAKRRAFKVNKDGVEIVNANEHPVRFQRFKGMRQLQIPKKPTKKHKGELGDWLNVSEQDLLLVKGWMLQAMRPYPLVGEYPILLLRGGEDSGKTFLAEFVTSLLHPTRHLVRLKPKEDVLQIAANRTRVLALDNLKKVSSEMSDILCGISTGSSSTRRKFYTVDEEVPFPGGVPILANGISDVASAGDLLSRSFLIDLPLIDDNDKELKMKFRERFYVEAPYIWYNLLEAYVEGLNNYEAVVEKGRKGPTRMLETAYWMTATLGDDAFDAYVANTGTVTNQAALDNSPIYGAIVLVLDANNGQYTNTYGELHRVCGNTFGMSNRLPRDWPTSTKAFTVELDKIKRSLLRDGIHIIPGEKTNKGRLVTITRTGPDGLPF